jgi:hypothetical protein
VCVAWFLVCNCMCDRGNKRERVRESKKEWDIKERQEERESKRGREREIRNEH